MPLSKIQVKEIKMQAKHAHENGAPITAKICNSVIALAQYRGKCAERTANWPGNILDNAMPLRLAGALHHLHLTSATNKMADIYNGKLSLQQDVDQRILSVVDEFDDEILPWFDGPPQTNEAARSASLIAALIWIGRHINLPFHIFEIGSSGGLNLLMPHYQYILGQYHHGPKNSPIIIQPEWRGNALYGKPPVISAICGCDINPLNLSDGAVAARLRAYIWPEMQLRFNRFERALHLAQTYKPHIDKMDAAAWLKQKLRAPPPQNGCRVIMHSIVWQYINDAEQTAIIKMLEDSGKMADDAQPLLWLSLETNRATFRHELHARWWDSKGEHRAYLGDAHAHGAWVDWRG
ncbi:hypothetical protein LPB140_10520 [Sphingorhabdus lutea]|uniref:DUF2332 domain-containing protein n=1 Tax=Sphingorhabdus lutea TaxID=1913578 RepID=A0A1L3JDC6_9SPHN|nr:DUF2332 domain-containing protein [Sphingorhabdus lutea]APG63151.1 hypothetical protein LPB140_10520 [Sphingorhabdus lutea]